MPDEDEILDLVDENDQIIGTIPRTLLEQRKLRNFRSIHAFIKNSEGKLWIPRRAAHKVIAPLGLDASVSGRVSSGESYEIGLRREAMEELNLDLTNATYKEIAYLTPAQHNVYCFEKVYEITWDSEPAFNDHDIVEAFWLTPDELRERIQQGEKVKSDLPKLIEILY